jgi:D-alanyl-D-alanine carboxypeptidase-like protein
MTYADLAHFNNYNPESFGWPKNVDLVPFEFDGINFGQCARTFEPQLRAFLTEFVPHIQGGLVSGKCWAYSATDDLPDGSWSFHHFGIAADLNWNVNHMGNNIPDATGKYAIPRHEATIIATKYGMEWGGNWLGGFHDNMHFEGHLSPTNAAKVVLLDGSNEMASAEYKALDKKLDTLLTKVQEAHDAVSVVLHGDNYKSSKNWPKGHPNALDLLGPDIRAIKQEVELIRDKVQP